MKVTPQYTKVGYSLLAFLVSISGQPAYAAGEVTASAGQNVPSSAPVSTVPSGNAANVVSPSLGKEAPTASKATPSANAAVQEQSSKQEAPSHGSVIKTGENHLLISLPPEETVGRQDVEYLCSLDDKKASEEEKSLRTSLPSGVFTATYFSADAMALVVLPVDGRVMVFANVVADSGSKYVGDRYIWWAKGGDVSFARADKNDAEIACHVELPGHNMGATAALAAPKKVGGVVHQKDTGSASQPEAKRGVVNEAKPIK